jgi:hypothetical protein
MVFENEDPYMIKLNKYQTLLLENYITATLKTYYSGKIYLSEELLKNFDKIGLAIENNSYINKSYVDFVLKDMENSYKRNGYSHKYNIYDDFY